MVESGLPNPDSADQIRKRMVNQAPSYGTLVGKSLIDDQMRSHYNMVGAAGCAVDDSKPAKSHYDFLAVSKNNPKWKPGIWDRYVETKRKKDYTTRMANTKVTTDARAPEAACHYSDNRRKYRQYIVNTPGFKRSGAYEVMWSWTEEQAALRYLARHARAVQISKGWTDSGPPEKAMQFREFRRSFKKPSILNQPPPKKMYGHLCDKKKRKRRCRSMGAVTSETVLDVESATLESSELPMRRQTSHGRLSKKPSEELLFKRDPDDAVDATRVWMPDSRSFVKKEVTAVAKKGSGGGLIGHGCRGPMTSGRPSITAGQSTQYALPKQTTAQAPTRLVASSSSHTRDPRNMYTLESGKRPQSRECLPVRRPQFLRHPRRLQTPEAPKSRTGTPTSFSVTNNFEAECSPGDGVLYEGLEGLKEEEEEEEYENDFSEDLADS